MLDGSAWHINELLVRLAPLHRESLAWFQQRAGEVHAWPGRVDLPSGTTFLASTPKGIYKPKWTHYALSVRQSLDGPYNDQVMERPDGTWSYAYFQEGFDAADVHAKATNRGLLACLVDSVPVGVFRQVAKGPSRYEILGLALVATYDGGFFFLEGAAPDGTVRRPGPAAEFERLEVMRNEIVQAAHISAPEVVAPLLARQRVFAEILRRRGQAAFREQLLAAYDGQCAMTGYDAQPSLEAAHIIPYADRGLSTPQNGLLLRADVHTLFDVGLVAVEPSDFTVQLSDRLAGTRYQHLEGKTLQLPRSVALRPSAEFLARHAAWARVSQ